MNSRAAWASLWGPAEEGKHQQPASNGLNCCLRQCLEDEVLLVGLLWQQILLDENMTQKLLFIISLFQDPFQLMY